MLSEKMLMTDLLEKQLENIFTSATHILTPNRILWRVVCRNAVCTVVLLQTKTETTSSQVINTTAASVQSELTASAVDVVSSREYSYILINQAVQIFFYVILHVSPHVLNL